jgi:hypothetical protein
MAMFHVPLGLTSRWLIGDTFKRELVKLHMQVWKPVIVISETNGAFQHAVSKPAMMAIPVSH